MGSDGNRLVLALGASVLLNCFLGGLYLGGLIGPGARPAAGAGGLAPAARVRLLPTADREAFARVMAGRRPALRAARQAARLARARVEADIGAPAFDRARLEADLSQLRAASVAQQTLAHAALTDALAAISPSARARLAAKVEAGQSVGSPAAAR